VQECAAVTLSTQFCESVMLTLLIVRTHYQHGFWLFSVAKKFLPYFVKTGQLFQKLKRGGGGHVQRKDGNAASYPTETASSVIGLSESVD